MAASASAPASSGASTRPAIHECARESGSIAAAVHFLSRPTASAASPAVVSATLLIVLANDANFAAAPSTVAEASATAPSAAAVTFATTPLAVTIE